ERQAADESIGIQGAAPPRCRFSGGTRVRNIARGKVNVSILTSRFRELNAGQRSHIRQNLPRGGLLRACKRTCRRVRNRQGKCDIGLVSNVYRTTLRVGVSQLRLAMFPEMSA